MSRCILFALEWGVNFGHMTRCLALARRCRAEGREVFIAASDLRAAMDTMAGEGFRLLQAPVLPPAEAGPRPVNYSGMLLRRGFGDPQGLSAAVNGWLSLFRLLDPDAVVCDYAPTALLALQLSSRRGIVLGSGIEIPSPVSLVPWEEPAPLLCERQDQLLTDNINQLMAEHGADRCSNFADLFERTPTFIFGFPALDPGKSRVGVDYLGVSREYPPMPVAQWSTDRPIKVLIYLHREIKEAAEIDAYLKKRGVESLILDGKPVALDEVLPTASLVITHGSDLSARSLADGVPVLVVPRTVEHYYAGLGVEETGGGALLKEEGGAAALIEVLLEDTAFRDRALAFSHENRGKFAELRAERQWAALTS